MPYCSQCGTEVNDKTKFCPECGAEIKKREKRAAVIPPVNLPTPKTVHGGARPASHHVERAEETHAPAREVTAAKPKDFKAAPQPAPISTGPAERPRDKEARAKMRKDNIKGALVAAAIVVALFLALPPIVLGHPIWDIFNEEHGWGGGGGSGNWDGTYSGETITETPMSTETDYGSFTVVNGYVSVGRFEGYVNSSGWFEGSIVVSEGAPAITVTGQFSLTDTFTLSGSYGNSSWTCYAYKT